MAGLFFGNYGKSGPGISKNGPEKGRVKLYFEILWVRLWKLFALNFIFTLFCIPIVTIGPAIAGMTRVLKNYAIDKHAYVFGDFWEGFKKDFPKALVLGIIDIIAYSGLILGIRMYPEFAKHEGYGYFYGVFAVTIAVGIAFTIMNFYMYLMLVSTNLSMNNIVKNSLYLSFLAPKQNLRAFVLAAAAVIVYVLLVAINLQFLFIVPFLPAAFIAFTICFICYPVVQKYVIDPFYEARGEVNPDYRLQEDPEEVIFEDMGGKEKPIEPEEKSKGKSGKRKVSVKAKGKTIT